MVRTLLSVINPQGIVARKLKKHKKKENYKNKEISTHRTRSKTPGNRYKNQPIPEWQKKITDFFEREKLISANQQKSGINYEKNNCNKKDNSNYILKKKVIANVPNNQYVSNDTTKEIDVNCDNEEVNV